MIKDNGCKKYIPDIVKSYTKHVTDIIKEFRFSNNDVYVVIKHKNFISANFAVITIVLGTFGFMKEGVPVFDAILKTIGLFGLNFPDGISIKTNLFIFIGSISAVSTVFLLAVVFFIRDFLNKHYIKKIILKEHTVVFGLGEINRSYLNSLDLKTKDNENKKYEDVIFKTLIVESDPTNKYIDEYREKGFGVLVGDALGEIVQNQLNYINMDNAIIAMGDDRHNIEFAKHIMKQYNAKNEIKLIVHIQNKDLEILFNTSFIQEKGKHINIKTFSFYEEVAKNLFVNNPVDGNTLEYINTKKEFKTVLLGDGELLEKI